MRGLPNQPLSLPCERAASAARAPSAFDQLDESALAVETAGVERVAEGRLSRPAREAGAAPPRDAQGCVSPVPSFESSPSKLAPCASQSPTPEDRIPIAVGVATELRSAGDWTSPLIWLVPADYGANEVSHLSEPRVRAGSRRLPRDYLHSREHGCLNRCDRFRHSLAGARTLSVSPTVDILDGV